MTQALINNMYIVLGFGLLTKAICLLTGGA